MSNYLSEQEQLDTIKKWWNQYGSALTTVILLIALSYAGWQWYKSTEEKRAVQASQSYEQLLSALSSQDDTQSNLLAERVITDFPKTIYADFASFTLAYNAVYHGALDDAKRYLQRVIDQSTVAEAKQIARIRLARILNEQQHYEQALELLSKVEYEALTAMIEEMKGDIYLAQGKLTEAKAAYQITLAQLSEAGVSSPLLQMKAQNVPQEKILTE